MTLFENPSHQQLHQVVSGQIRAAIQDGRIKPGQWIRQKNIAEELGVSQMPVREALKELAAEGLIEHIPYRGVRVVEFSKEDIRDIYAHRGYLESFSAGFVASKITDAEIEIIKNVQNQLEAHTRPDLIQEYRKLNREFHQTIYRISKRDYIIRTLDQMWATFPTMLIGKFSITSQTPIFDRIDTDIHEHRIIIKALENRDSKATEQAFKNHIDSVYKDLMIMLQKQPIR